MASTLPASDLPVTFGDESEMPDYGGIAAAAGGAWAGRLKDFENAEVGPALQIFLFAHSYLGLALRNRTC